jgi:outer membrane protein TolC
MACRGTADLRSYLVAVAAALLSACASYQPVPLEETGRPALASPAVDELRVAAASLQHPYLAPLALDLEDGLSPDEAAVLAVLANPDLAALRAQRGLAEAQLLAAGILPNPQLVLGASVARNNPTGVTGSTFGLGLDLAALITRGARRESARLSREQVDLDVAWQEWQVAQAARLQLYRRFYLEAQERLAGEREETLGESYRLAEVAAERRLVTEIDRAAAEAALNEARALRLEAATQAEQARLELSRLLGFPPDRTFEVQLSEEHEPAPPALAAAAGESPAGDHSIAGLEARRLDLAALRLGYESQEERVRAAVLAQFPSINISVAHTKDTDGLRTLDPAVTIDFPIFDRNQGEIAAERASREILRREYAARLFQARADVAELTAAAASVRRQIAQADETVQARRSLVEIYGQALRFGDADVLTFHDAQIDLLTSELDRLALRLSLAQVQVGLATVLGRTEPQ